MSGDVARWLANETAAALAHDAGDGCLTHVPMVCTTCRKPVTRGESTGLWFHSDTSDPERCSRTVPVKAMVAAGNENVPRPLVCASCAAPVERTFDDDFQHVSVDDGLACTAWPVRPAPMAGEETSDGDT